MLPRKKASKKRLTVDIDKEDLDVLQYSKQFEKESINSIVRDSIREFEHKEGKKHGNDI